MKKIIKKLMVFMVMMTMAITSMAASTYDYVKVTKTTGDVTKTSGLTSVGRGQEIRLSTYSTNWESSTKKLRVYYNFFEGDDIKKLYDSKKLTINSMNHSSKVEGVEDVIIDGKSKSDYAKVKVTEKDFDYMLIAITPLGNTNKIDYRIVKHEPNRDVKKSSSTSSTKTSTTTSSSTNKTNTSAKNSSNPDGYYRLRALTVKRENSKQTKTLYRGETVNLTWEKENGDVEYRIYAVAFDSESDFERLEDGKFDGFPETTGSIVDISDRIKDEEYNGLELNVGNGDYVGIFVQPKIRDDGETRYGKFRGRVFELEKADSKYMVDVKLTLQRGSEKETKELTYYTKDNDVKVYPPYVRGWEPSSTPRTVKKSSPKATLQYKDEANKQITVTINYYEYETFKKLAKTETKKYDYKKNSRISGFYEEIDDYEYYKAYGTLMTSYKDKSIRVFYVKKGSDKVKDIETAEVRIVHYNSKTRKPIENISDEVKNYKKGIRTRVYIDKEIDGYTKDDSYKILTPLKDETIKAYYTPGSKSSGSKNGYKITIKFRSLDGAVIGDGQVEKTYRGPRKRLYAEEIEGYDPIKNYEILYGNKNQTIVYKYEKNSKKTSVDNIAIMKLYKIENGKEIFIRKEESSYLEEGQRLYAPNDVKNYTPKVKFKYIEGTGVKEVKFVYEEE